MSAGKETPSRTLISGLPRMRASSLAEMNLVVNAPSEQQARHRHSSFPGMTPLDFGLGGQHYSVDGLNSGYFGVAFKDTPFGAYPHGLPLPEPGRPSTEPSSIPVTTSELKVGQEKTELKPRMNADQARAVLFSYMDRPQTRFDLETDANINKLREGVKRFKKYNIHSQPESDYSGNGAFGLGDDRPFRVPNHNRYPLLFPNDTRVMSLADEFTPEDRGLVESALDKMATLYIRKGIISNYSAQSALDVPARPVFLPTALEWYLTHPDRDDPAVRQKFQSYMEIGAQEHDHIWNNAADLTGAIGTSHAMVPGYTWLRRAGDMDTGTNGYNSSRVMGWDRSGARFGGSEEAALPICINAILLRNKQILAFASEELGVPLNGRDATEWRQAASEMGAELHDKQFDPYRGTYLDRDHEDHKLIDVVSLASAWPLVAGLPHGDNALSTIGQLSYLDSGKGLLTTAEQDSLTGVSNEQLIAAGVPRKATKAIHKLLVEHNWDARLWLLEEVVATEGNLNYILPNDKGLNLQARLAINRFTQKIVHDQLQLQMDTYLETGKFPEKWLANGQIDNGHHQYEPQKDGLGATAAVTELNMDIFLPILYRSEDALLQAIESGQKDIDLTGIRMDVIRELQEKRTAELAKNGQTNSIQQESAVHASLTGGLVFQRK